MISQVIGRNLVHNCSSADDEMAVIRKFRPFELTHADGDQSIHVCCGPEGPKLSQNALLLFSGLFVVWLVIFCDLFFFPGSDSILPFQSWVLLCIVPGGRSAEGGGGRRRWEYLFLGTELYGRRLTRKMNGKVTGNHTYLNSASCVKHFREIR